MNKKKCELPPSSEKTSFREILSAFPLDGDDVLLPTFDALMTECAPKRPRRSPRFTDDKTFEASAVDVDFQLYVQRSNKIEPPSDFFVSYKICLFATFLPTRTVLVRVKNKIYTCAK